MGRRSSSTAPTEVGSRELARETRPGRSRWRARQVEARAMRRVLEHRGGGGSAARSGWQRLVASPGRRELALFAAIYLLYDGARWAFHAHLRTARAHAHWIIHLERSLHVAVEGQVRRALDAGVASFLLANVYLAAQLVVLAAAAMRAITHVVGKLTLSSQLRDRSCERGRRLGLRRLPPTQERPGSRRR
jgi:hypothetical protein